MNVIYMDKTRTYSLALDAYLIYSSFLCYTGISRSFRGTDWFFRFRGSSFSTKFTSTNNKCTKLVKHNLLPLFIKCFNCKKSLHNLPRNNVNIHICIQLGRYKCMFYCRLHVWECRKNQIKSLILPFFFEEVTTGTFISRFNLSSNAKCSDSQWEKNKFLVLFFK